MTEPTDALALRTALDRDGYAVIPNFFSADEVFRMRDTVQRFFDGGRGTIYNLGKTQPNAAIECPELAWLFADSKVTMLFKQLFGDGGAMFTGHCDLHSSIVSNWHRDTGGPGHPYFDEPCFVPDCRVYKVAIYLQDHADGNGLTVNPGSHARDALPDTRELSLKTRTGDIVVFDVRLRHRGRKPNIVEQGLLRAGRTASRLATRLSGGYGFTEQPRWAYALRDLLDRISGTPEKLSIFFTYGARNRFSEQFARTNMQRQLGQYTGGGNAYPDGLVEQLGRAEVAVYMP